MTSTKLIESTIIQEDDPAGAPLEDMLERQGHDESDWRAEVELAHGTPDDALWIARGPLNPHRGFGRSGRRGRAVL